jgi:hypothetical protein
MGAAAGVGADQHPAALAAGQLGQRQPGRANMLSRGVGPGVAGPQHDGQRLPARRGAVVGECGQRVKPVGLLPRRRGLLLLRVRGHERGVDVHRDQRPARARRPAPGQRPGSFAGGGPRGADRPQRPGRLRSQRADQPGHHRIGGHRAGQLRLRAQHRHIGQAVPAQRQRHHQIGEDLPRVMRRPRRPPPGQPRRQAPAQAGGPQRLQQQQRPSLGHETPAIGGHGDLGTAHGILHLESAFGSARTGPQQALSSQAKGTFYVHDAAPKLFRRKPEARYLTQVLARHVGGGGTDPDGRGANERAGKIWGKSEVRVRSKILEIARNNGFSDFRQGSPNSVNESEVMLLARMTPAEAVHVLAPYMPRGSSSSY